MCIWICCILFLTFFIVNMLAMSWRFHVSRVTEILELLPQGCHTLLRLGQFPQLSGPVRTLKILNFASDFWHILTYSCLFYVTSCCIYLKKKTPSFSWTSNSSSPARATCLGPPTPHQHTSAISPTRLDIFKNKLCRNWNRFEQVLLLIHFVFSVYPRYTLDFRYPKVSSIIINYHQLCMIIRCPKMSKASFSLPGSSFSCASSALAWTRARCLKRPEAGGQVYRWTRHVRCDKMWQTYGALVHYPWFVRSWTKTQGKQEKLGIIWHNAA